MASLILASLAAAALAYTLTPPVRFAAVRLGMLDKPGVRRVHKVPVPLGGGVAIYAAFWLIVGLSYKAFPGLSSSGLRSLFWASTGIVVLGLADDKFELRPILKLAGQLLLAYFVVRQGHRVDFVTNPLGGMLYLGGWGLPLTILWIVAITNMVNLIDGLDGLAAGVSAIACIPLTVVALQMQRPGIALLTLILSGSAFGFLPHNFNPARIFMGDTGAMFLGFMLGVVSVDGALKGAATIALTVPLLALGVPAFDTFFAVVRRVLSGRPFYEADQGHLHHRLLALGLTQRQTVYALYAVSGLLGLGSIWSMALDQRQGVILFLAVVVAAGVAAMRVGVLPSPHERRGGQRRSW